VDALILLSIVPVGAMIVMLLIAWMLGKIVILGVSF
jgi:hypothetical protein